MFLLGRGIRVPMLVILVGAIGGLLAAGILGPVVMALAYELLTAWLAEQPEAGAASAPAAPGAIDGAHESGVAILPPV